MPLSGEAPGRKKGLQDWLRTNQGVGSLLTVCLALFLIHLQLSPWVHEKLRDGFTLGFFPVVGVVSMMVFTVVLVLDGWRKERIQELSGMTWRAFFFCLAVLAGCWVYFELIVRVGFLLVSPFFLPIFMYSLGMRPWSSSLVAGFVVTAIVYAVFRLIGIQLPPGILPF